MPLVEDRPHPASTVELPERDLVGVPWPDPRQAESPGHGPVEAPWPDPWQGVIEEARRRQQRRRRRLAGTTIMAVVLIAMAGAFVDGRRATPAHTDFADHDATANPQAPRVPLFNIRLAPTLEVGRAGWQVFYEEHGEQVGSTASGPAVGSDAYLVAEGSVHGSGPWITRFVTAPNVAAILIEGRTHVPTVPVPGLPYGYRTARVLTPFESVTTSGMPLDAEHRPILSRPNNREPIQARVTSWQYPGRTPEGSCGLRASPMPGLTARGGHVATAIRPYLASSGGRRIVGHAFLPCVSVEYALQGVSLRALILLDAAHPFARAAALPDFKPVSGAPGFVGEGGLTAKRDGDAWLIVAQGAGVAQRVALLRHLTPLVKLEALVPASAGVAWRHPSGRAAQTSF